MIQRHRNQSAVLSIFFAVLFLSLAGCAPPKSQFRNSFVPPHPRPLVADDLTLDPPEVSADLYSKEQPNFLPAALVTPRSSDVEARLRRSEDHYRSGQRAYQQGDVDAARSEFDYAVDLLLTATATGPDRQRIERRLEQMVDEIYRYDVNGLGSGEDVDKVVYDKSPLDEIREMTFPVDPRLKSKVRDEIAATSSQLPLELNDSVLSSINFFSSDRGRKILSYGMKRSGRYRPMIQRVLEEEKVPQELIYLAQIESGFYPRAISYRSCVGMWQFQAWRGKEYGLNRTAFVDERMDPEKSTRAAARHLHDLYTQFGDWYLAMAAYNCGPGCVDRAVQRTGFADFWKLRDMGALPKETTNYVPVIVAITIMMKNARDYGMDQIEIENPLEYDTVKLEADTHLALVADAAAMPISELRDLNPALLRGIGPAGHELHVPKGMGPVLLEAFESVPREKRATWRLHKVEPGETLAVIAKRYRAGTDAILAANKSTRLDTPAVGELLVIPAAPEPATRVRAAAKRAETTVASRGSKRKAAVRAASAKSSVARAAVVRKTAYTSRAPKALPRKGTVKTASLR
jgi:membrane-bound lytic murein transglycosylase D